MMKKILLLLFILTVFLQCEKAVEHTLLTNHQKFIDYVFDGKGSFYAITIPSKSKPPKDLAIGIFDSGIGGLTVFNTIINDDYSNR
jgi:hypothetical protein